MAKSKKPVGTFERDGQRYLFWRPTLKEVRRLKLRAQEDEERRWYDLEHAHQVRSQVRTELSRAGGKRRGQQQRAGVAAEWDSLRQRAEAFKREDPDLSEEELAEKLKTTRKRLRKALGKSV